MTGYSAVNEPTCYAGTNEECNRYGITEDITRPWNTEVGYLASTTGNISGIYDMSGGTVEYVMGVMVDQNGKPMSGRNSFSNSGFNGTFGCPTCDNDTSGLLELTDGVPFPTDARYYDTYDYVESNRIYSRRILGDVTGEMGPFATVTYGTQQRLISSWYADEAWFIHHIVPWFIRGSAYYQGSCSGVFSYNGTRGHAFGGGSFRIVLAGGNL